MQESVDASLVRIRTADGRVVGAGFLVGERQILTCAHVVSQALGLNDYPVDPPQGEVWLDFPLIAPGILSSARVVLWCPPLLDGRGDIAGLELQGEPPAGAEVVRFAPAKDVWEHPFRAFGFPAGYDDGVWATGRLLGRQATGWAMIEDVKAQGFAVGPGFSGTPVWDTQLQGVVGMVVAASRPADTKAAFVIPLDVLVTAWPHLTIPKGEPRNPYKGLRPFTQDDAGDFFGREQVVEKLVDTVAQLVVEQPAAPSKRLLTILGPSGSGKSSLVMAGLLPQLRHGALPGSEAWIYLKPMVPGKHPLEALVLTLAARLLDRSFTSIREDLEDEAARGLHQMAAHLLSTQQGEQPGAKVVLLVDQFEELFTQTESEDERQRFIKLLLVASGESRGPLLVLLTLRADFYDRPMDYPELYQLIEAHQVALLSMERNNLRRVIEQPAALPDVQLAFEGDLLQNLLSEVEGQAGALPLLQFTLDQLYQYRHGRQLTLEAYQEIGGVKGALSQHAERTYAALPSEEHRKLARTLFLRLIDPGMTEQDTTRRRAALSEFALPDPTQTRLMRETMDAFIAARLLTTNEIAGTRTIEVSHEALIREWPRLAGWLREAREDIRLQQTISKDAAEWEQHNKPGDRLYRGSQLKEAQAWARRNTPSGNEVAFLRAGAARRVRDIAIVTVIVLLLLSTTGLAGWLRSRIPADPTYVNTLSDNGPGSLRYAVNEAPAGRTITFGASLRGTILLSSGDLNIAKNLTIRGPGAGILSISSGKSGHIVRVAPGVTVTISGLTFKDSKTSNGFIYNEGMLTLSNSTVSGNMSTGFGGGVYNGLGGTLTLSNSTVSGNTTSGQFSDGGGISNSGTLTLSNSTISANTAQDEGGGIYNAPFGTLTLTNSSVSSNTATNGGGGIYNTGTLMLSNSTVSGNKASLNGGGIWSAGKLTLSNSTISGNTATNGGGIANSDGTLMLTDSTISDNKASNDGGGIANSDGTLTLTDSTISDNKASNDGGGIAIDEDISFNQPPPSVMLLYCTVYRNTADVGGGIWAGNLKQGHVTTRACIVAGNNAHTGPDVAGSLTTLGYNLVGDRSGATFLGSPKLQSTDKVGVSSTDLKIDPMLRDNGGSAKPHTRTHALLPGSPAIDAIPPDVCMSFKVFNDQRGVRRPQGKGCDSGAYEYAP